MMFRSQLLILVLCCLPFAACLHCYTCDLTVSPEKCSETPLECPAGQQCLTIYMEERRGEDVISMYEKRCGHTSQCGRKEQKQTKGATINITNTCCDTDLCNQAVSLAALRWGGVVLCLLPALSLLLA